MPRDWNVMARSTEKKQEEPIGEAIDSLIHQAGRSHRESALQKTAGLWKDRKDLPDFSSIRSEWDRGEGVKTGYSK